MWKSVPVIWQNCLYVDSVPCASDLAELPVPVIWQQCLHVEERASDLAELPVCGQCASGLAELPVLCTMQRSMPVIWNELPVPCANDLAELSAVCGQCASGLAELPVCRGVCHVPVIWQELPVPMFGKIACMWTLLCQWFGRIAYTGEYANDLAELPVPVIWQQCLYVDSVPVVWQNCLYAEQ